MLFECSCLVFEFEYKFVLPVVDKSWTPVRVCKQRNQYKSINQSINRWILTLNLVDGSCIVAFSDGMSGG